VHFAPGEQSALLQSRAGGRFRWFHAGRDPVGLIPLDRSVLLQIGEAPFETSDQTLPLKARYPWMKVTRARLIAKRVVPLQPTLSCDCVYISEELPAILSSSALLRSVYDLLTPGGVLVGAAPKQAVSDGSLHPDLVARRLTAAGFTRIEGVARRRRGPASVTVIRAWKPPLAASPVDRIDALRRWAYAALTPGRGVDSDDAEIILSKGSGWCRDYAIIVGEAMRREGVDVRWVSMTASGLPRDRWPSGVDTHEAVEVTLPDGTEHVVDATVDVRFPSPLRDLLRDPRLADVPRPRDDRFVTRGYAAYSTSFWYRRVTRVQVRASPADPNWSVPVERVITPTRLTRRLLKPRARPILRTVRAVVRKGRHIARTSCGAPCSTR
jgi:hypothetical protein